MSFQRMVNGQMQLMLHYHDIEKDNGVVVAEELPMDLDNRAAQVRLKDLAWRLTEELMGEVAPASTKSEKLAELVDVWHFYLELCITAGATKNSPLYGSFNRPTFLDWDEVLVRAMTNLSLAMHALKNRPWRRTHTCTNSNEVLQRLGFVGHYLGKMFCLLGVTDEEHLARLYFEKHEENMRRIVSGY